jgi:hypothetical protein
VWHGKSGVSPLRLNELTLNRSPHLSKPRVIKPGQKIHASVAFIKNYAPIAILRIGNWRDILGKGSRSEISWADGLRDILELDLFDLSNTQALIEDAPHDNTSLDRLRFLSSTRTGYFACCHGIILMGPSR